MFGLARYAILDTIFTALLFGGVGLVAVAALRDRPRLQYPGYCWLPAAVMIKGPLALVLCGLTMGLAIAASADVRRRLLGLHWIAGLAMAVAIAAPWFVYMYLRFRGDFVAGYVLDENIMLFATERFTATSRRSGFIFRSSPPACCRGPASWSAGWSTTCDRPGARRASDSVEVLLWAWTIAVVGFFTFSRFKLDHYVFPVAPTLCLLCARAWVDVRSFPDAPEHRGARIGILLVGPLPDLDWRRRRLLSPGCVRPASESRWPRRRSSSAPAWW